MSWLQSGRYPFQSHLYRNTFANAAIFLGSALLIAGSLSLVRSQTTVQDVSWMRAEIPHYSVAILISERANHSDPRVRSLANDIFEAQRQGIGELGALILDLQGNLRATPEIDGR